MTSAQSQDSNKNNDSNLQTSDDGLNHEQQLLLRNLLLRLLRNKLEHELKNDSDEEDENNELLRRNVFKKSFYKPRVGRRNWLNNDIDDESDEFTKRSFLKPRVGK